MPVSPPENDCSLKTGNVVIVGLDLPDMTFAEDVATVICVDNGEVKLQLCGSGLQEKVNILAGARVLIAKGEGPTRFQCTAMLKNAGEKGVLTIDLPKKVVVSERRKHMRIDVAVPVNYYLPRSQNLAQVIAEWESAKECNGSCGERAGLNPAEPKNRVNLSGGGLRVNIPDRFSCGTLLHLKIALPGEKHNHIHAVGSIVRTKELPSESTQVEYYSTSMSFRVIENSDRHKLARHILEEQRNRVTTKQGTYLWIE